MPYNIITQTVLKNREEECRKMDEHNVIIPETKIVRDFDIVTNNQYKDHISKFSNDKKKEYDERMLIQNKARTVNTITAKYYDQEKENKVLDEKHKKFIERQKLKERM